MTTIESLLHRRTDLSTFLVHLTRDGEAGDDTSARDNLLSIADNNLIEARTAFGPAAECYGDLAGTPSDQKAVCFTETPLEHTWVMLEDIEGRSIRFQPYGIAITKTTARRDHFNPVWYSDISARGRDWPATAINRMIKDAVSRSVGANGKVDVNLLQAEPIFQVTPFFEQMGPTGGGRRKEFWWEREWRHIGPYAITPSKVVCVLAPAEDHDTLRKQLTVRNAEWGKRPILDPWWGLERMIASLAEVADDAIGPFPAAR